MNIRPRSIASLTVAAALSVGLALVGGGCSTETRVSEIEPNFGTFSGGEEVVIKGNAFPRSGAVVRFGTKEAQPVMIESDNAIKVYTPAGDKGTQADVSVVFNDGRAFVLKSAFRYVDSTGQRQAMEKGFDKVNNSGK
jgi:hypothetical protein